MAKKTKIIKVDKYARFHKIDKELTKDTIKAKGKCLSCLKPMFKSRNCRACLKKKRLKRKANSRGRPKSNWEEYK